MFSVDEPKMTLAEAQACVKNIRGHLQSARQRLQELYRREGWRVLGYDTFRQCAFAEFGKSASQAYRELTAANIEEELAAGQPDPPPIGTLPESHARILAGCPDEDKRRAAMKRAQEIATAENATGVTARHISQAVKAVLAEDDVYTSDYKLVTHLYSTGEISVETPGSIWLIDRMDPKRQGYALQFLAPPYNSAIRIY